MWTHTVGAGITGEGRPRSLDHPAPTVAAKGTAYFLAGAAVWRDGSDDALSTGRAARVGPEEMGLLQGFPADHPWQGTRAKRYEQAGNAVPPPLAEAILRAVARPAATRRQP